MNVEKSSHNENPKVSVCVQTYQHEAYISECLESILAQETTFPFEIIVGEDESKDNTRAICEKYAQQFPATIRLFKRSREDTIFMFGRPTGRFNVVENMKAAKGDYIAICEGDDYWTDSSKLQQQIEFLELNADAVGCFHNSSCVNGESEIIRDTYFEKDEHSWYDQEATLKTLKSRYSTAALVFRTSAIKDQLDQWIKIGSDFILDTLITRDGKLFYIDKNMSAYRIHSGGIWQGSTSVYNLQIDLARHLFLYKHPHYNKKYNHYLWNKIIVFYEEILHKTKDPALRAKYVTEEKEFINYSELRVYPFLFKKIAASLRYRFKKLIR